MKKLVLVMGLLGLSACGTDQESFSQPTPIVNNTTTVIDDTHPDKTVQLCSTDTSSYPEYGLEIYNRTTGNYDLYAVYWGSTPVSGGVPQSFLSLLTPGSYRSTGGDGCAFTYHADGSITYP